MELKKQLALLKAQWNKVVEALNEEMDGLTLVDNDGDDVLADATDDITYGISVLELIAE